MDGFCSAIEIPQGESVTYGDTHFSLCVKGEIGMRRRKRGRRKRKRRWRKRKRMRLIAKH